jgi:hypothetical protein
MVEVGMEKVAEAGNVDRAAEVGLADNAVDVDKPVGVEPDRVVVVVVAVEAVGWSVAVEQLKKR